MAKWTRAEGKTDQKIPVRFTQKGDQLYATLLGTPKANSIMLNNVSVTRGSQMHLLSSERPIAWPQKGADVEVQLPASLLGKYAYVLQMEPAA